MSPRPRVHEIPAAAIAEAISDGADIKAVAHKYGVPYGTFFRRVKEARRASTSGAPAQPDSAEKPQPESAPPPNPEAGGAEAAAAAAGLSGGPKEKSSPPQPPAQAPDSKAVVALAELVTSITVKCCAVGWGVPVTAEVERLGALTASERSQLEMLAPYAAPYIERILKHMDKIGAALFGVAYVLMLGRRLSDLKARRPEKPEAKEEPAGPGPASATTRPPAAQAPTAGNSAALAAIAKMPTRNG